MIYSYPSSNHTFYIVRSLKVWRMSDLFRLIYILELISSEMGITFIGYMNEEAEAGAQSLQNEENEAEAASSVTRFTEGFLAVSNNLRG